MKKKYDIMVFDLDDTLIDNYFNIQYAFQRIIKDRKEEYTEEKFERFYQLDHTFWKDRANGRIEVPKECQTIEEKVRWVRAQRFVLYFGDLSLEEASKINDTYIEALKEKVVPIEGAKETIQYLYDKGYEVVVATNGPLKAIKAKLDKIEILPYIKEIFSAEECGHMKPHQEFFEGVKRKLGNPKAETMLFVGDELEKDIKGGIQNGIHTCWLNRKGGVAKEYIPNYEITKLEQLREIL